MRKTSRLAGFFKRNPQERVHLLRQFADLTEEDVAALSGHAGLSRTQADHMIENCIGTFELPLGLAMNLRINGVDRLVPMAIEEPSVLAGLSKAEQEEALVRICGQIKAAVNR